MFTNRLFNLVIISALLAVVSLTIRESIATSAVARQVQEAQPIQGVAEMASQRALTEYDASEASAYRWEAMANYYRENGMLNGTERQLPLTGSSQQKQLTEYDAGEASAYRWEAMAKFYKEHEMLTRTEP